MFDVTKALKKLDEISKEKNWVHDGWKVTGEELREILLAGHEDDIGDRLELFQKQINDMKAAIGTTKKAWREDIEERLARLEDLVAPKYSYHLSSVRIEPSKPTEEYSICSKHHPLNRDEDCPMCQRKVKPLPSKAEGKTPDYLMGIEGKTPDYLTCGKLEKPVTEECVAYEGKRMKVMEKHCNPDTTTEAKSSWQPLVDIYKERAEFYLTKLCWKWQDIAYLLDYVFHCGIPPKLNDDKPSEFISRDTIYCAVSAGLEKYRTTWAKENRGVRDCVTDTVMDTIKQQLG